MNTQLLPLTAAALFALCAGSALVASHDARADSAARIAASTSTTAIVDLPTVTVRPEAADLAYFRANRIVDLATITVRPEPQDAGAYIAGNAARVVDMPSMTVRPSAEDVRVAAVGALALVQHVASR